MKPDMKCLDQEQLFAYTHHMLEPGEEGVVRAHVLGCAGCREIVDGYQRLEVALEAWKPADPSPWFDARVRAAVARDRKSSSRSFLGRILPGLEWGQWLAPACMAMLVVVASVVVVRNRRPLIVSNGGTGQVVQTGRQITTPASGPSGMDTGSVAEADVTVDDYDMLANFDVLSEIPRGQHKAAVN